jgi:hypothetical protein
VQGFCALTIESDESSPVSQMLQFVRLVWIYFKKQTLGARAVDFLLG